MKKDKETFDVLLVGSGNMAMEYLKILKDLKKKVLIIGKSKKNVNFLKNLYPQFSFRYGGVKDFFKSSDVKIDSAINTVNIERLSDVTEVLLKKKVKHILVEKPAALNISSLRRLMKISNESNSKIFIAYNRRFYSSINKLSKEIEKDGGIQSVNFEFTEWTHTFGKHTHDVSVLNKWVISNSSHVLDTVFYLIGNPETLKFQINGQNKIKWHPSGSIFSGFGISSKNIPFSYQANWNSAGRWSIEVLTKKRRFFLKPLEELFYQNVGSVEIKALKIDKRLDTKYKPGLFLQTQAFLNREHVKLKNLKDQIHSLKTYNKIAGY